MLNDYLYGLSQHPGRRVEASIASAGEPGKVVLDYLVHESKSWQIFSQVNNYGTEATGEIRGRLGFQANQLTNHDDVFNVDVISTTDFKTYGSFLSYRIPILRPTRLLARVYGSYGDFLANSGDASLASLKYGGKNWLGGLELTNRVTLWRDWQLLSALGVNYSHYGIQSLIDKTPLITGAAEFMVPFIGTTLGRDAGWWSVAGGLRIDHTVGSPDSGPSGYPALGRISSDPQWTSARWNIGGALYLEPLFDRAAVNGTLAHEASLRLKGRVLLRGSRLIPHEQEPLGGALTIRGYPESILSADEFISATAEYAYHIPRALTPAPAGKLFK
ncbi:MAG: ShlB/FhaC/HecB family hemolysin secretion/activation protein, partial [Opitutus sp.]